jgi:hypothetical protein
MAGKAAELKARLQKISEAKNLGKLTYKITGSSTSGAHTSVAALILHFENFTGVGIMQFDRLSENCGDAGLAKNLSDYLYDKQSKYDPLASNLGCRKGDIIACPIPDPDDIPRFEKAAKKLVF